MIISSSPLRMASIVFKGVMIDGILIPRPLAWKANFIAMKNFELKKSFGNLVEMPTTMKQPVTKPML